MMFECPNQSMFLNIHIVVKSVGKYMHSPQLEHNLPYVYTNGYVTQRTRCSVVFWILDRKQMHEYEKL